MRSDASSVFRRRGRRIVGEDWRRVTAGELRSGSFSRAGAGEDGQASQLIGHVGEQLQFFADDAADDGADILAFAAGDLLNAFLKFRVQVDRDAEDELSLIHISEP